MDGHGLGDQDYALRAGVGICGGVSGYLRFTRHSGYFPVSFM